MFQNLFSSSTSIWTALVGGMIALPILIHLINLMRHKQVEWAAMEFLLKSHKKNRNWVWLKQLLLLLSRIAALLLALFMLGQVGCNEDRIARILGGETTHHYVLLDDSFSMTDQGTNGTAFDKARATLSMIAARARNRQNQKFTLLRFSKANVIGSSEGGTGSLADLNGHVVDSVFGQLLEETKSRLGASNLAATVTNAAETIAALVEERTDENAIVYVLSDFREKDWANPSEVKPVFKRIHDAGAGIEMIDCVKAERPNVAITELVAAGNVRVAGTPMMMRLSVKNCGVVTANKVQIKIETQAFDKNFDVNQGIEQLEPSIDDLPTVFVESIEPGATESREFPVYFSSVGQHVVRAQVADDAIAVDNEYWNATRYDSAAQVLIIDNGDSEHAGFLQLALNPGGMTGITPTVRTTNFLRDTPLDQLEQFDVLYLLDVERLDESAVKNLEAFVARGGGAGFFLGPRTNNSFFTNQLYRNGDGVFPMPLEKTYVVPELVEERIPDIAPVVSSIFPAAMKNPLLDLVQIKQLVQPPIDWLNNRSADIAIAATLRGDETKPLVVQSRFGKGSVVVFTTTAGPVWNNWSRNGTFPPIMLLVENLLAGGRYEAESNLVGVPLEISAPTKAYDPQLTFVVPVDSQKSQADNRRLAIKKRMGFNDAGDQYQITLGDFDSQQSSDVSIPGVYDVWMRTSNNQTDARRFALNVDHSESDMKLVNQQSLLGALDDSKPTLINWDQFNPEPKQETASSLSKLLLFALLALLAVEQWLAYSTSYHR